MCKDVAFEAYREGYKLGHDVEELDSMDKKLIENRFERWWSINYE